MASLVGSIAIYEITGMYFKGTALSSLCFTAVALDLTVSSMLIKTVLAMANDSFLLENKCTTYLNYNAEKGSLLKVKFLLFHGANPNETHEGKHLPALYSAIQGKSQEVIKLIIEKGGRPLNSLPLKALKLNTQENKTYNIKSVIFAEIELAKQAL